MAVAVLLLLLLAPDLIAQLAEPRLTAIFPPGGQRGTTVEVTLLGVELQDGYRLVFGYPGFTSEPRLDDARKPVAGKFTVTIASNTPPGTFDARLLSRNGISNPRAFVVGDRPEKVASGTNSARASADAIEIDSVVNGRVRANQEDYFRFAGQTGKRLFISCAVRDIDSRLEPSLTLYDPHGNEMARVRRAGFMDVTLTADGDWILKVADSIFRGGDDFFYRLEVSGGPHLDLIFPAAGIPGRTNQFTIYGRNLSAGAPSEAGYVAGKPVETMDITLSLPPHDPAASAPGFVPGLAPAAAALDFMEYRWTGSNGVSNPLRLGFAEEPIVREREPNDPGTNAQWITPPCEIAGQFFPAGDEDNFDFEAKAGEKWWIEMISQRLGLPTDPFLVVQRLIKNEHGELKPVDVTEHYDGEGNIGDRDFNTLSRDPTARLDVKEDGRYRITVRDLFGRMRSDLRAAYRLVVRRVTPDFRLVAIPMPPRPLKADSKEVSMGSTTLRREETWPIRVLAFRTDGFQGAIQLGAEALAAGLHCAGASIESGKNSTLLLFTSTDATATAAAQPVRILGRAKIGDSQVVREARAGSLLRAVPDYQTEAVFSRVVDRLWVGRAEGDPAPVVIRPAEEKIWETTETAKLSIPLQIVRRGEFGTLKLKPAGESAIDSMKEIEVDAKTNGAIFQLDAAQQKLSPGLHTIYLQTQTTGKYRDNAEAVRLAEGATKAAEKTASDLAATAKTAAEDLAKVKAAFAEAEAKARAVAEKLAAVKLASEQAPTDQKLAGERALAEKEGMETAVAVKSAAAAKVEAEKVAIESGARAKDAEAKKQSAATKAKELAEKNKIRDLTLTVYSVPIRIQVAAVEKPETAEKK